MAGNTTFFHLAYFDYKDPLDSAINVQKEIHRFSFIDSQIYGMYTVFGNGVIDGWDAYNNGYSDTSSITAGITTGSGIIRYTSCASFEPVILGPLPANSTLYVYATSTNISSQSRAVSFVYSTSSSTASDKSVLVAKIITSDNGISSIDNTIKTYIGFAQYLKDEVDDHKHRGTPTKIDLDTETKNELPGARIESFGADKITNGRFDETRIPTIDHSDLENKGIVTHAGLDTFVSDLTTMQLMGEISSVNLLQSIIAWKRSESNIDKFMLNELAYIPSLSPLIPDTNNTTAYIDDLEDYVVGLGIYAEGTSYFFTKNYPLPGAVTNVLMTYNGSIPNGGEITLGVNTTNSTNWDDYTIIDVNKVSPVEPNSDNVRFGIKFVSPTDNSGDPDDNTFNNFIDFVFLNSSTVKDFHFRVRFYEDESYDNLLFTRFSVDNQEGWTIEDTSVFHPLQDCGYTIAHNHSVVVYFYPRPEDFYYGKKYFIKIDAWDGTEFVSEVDGYNFIECPDSVCGTASSFAPADYGKYSFIRNFAVMFELDNGTMTRLNQGV